MEILYLIVAVFATFVGAVSGFGGGVIIKPILDALGNYNTYVIGILSSATVLCMAIVSSAASLKNKTEFDNRLIYIVLGSIAGGLIGKKAFSIVFEILPSARIEIIQASILLILLIFILFKNRFKHYDIKSPFISVLSGVLLGSLSAFLGIGGGPFNIAVLCILFSMDAKAAVTASLFIIVFSQGSSLLATASTTGFGDYSYKMLYYMIPGGILSGLISSKIKYRIPSWVVEKSYFAIVIALIALNLYNIIHTVSEFSIVNEITLYHP